MKSNKIIITSVIVLIILIIIALLGIILYKSLNNPFIGKWKNEIIINDNTIKEEIIINRNKTITLIKKESNESKENIYEGSWKRKKNNLYVSFKENGKWKKYTLSLVPKNNLILFESNNPELNEYYNEKAIEEYGLYDQIDFKEIIERIYFDENTDIDIYDYFSLSFEGVTNEINSGTFPKTTISKEYTFDSNYNIKEDKNKVVVYLFYGDGCKTCDELLKGLDSLDKKLKRKFVVKMYETWYNPNNESYLQKITDYRNEQIEGLPYIIIGKKSWNNYNKEYLQEFIDEINSGTTYDIGKKIKLT